MDEAAIPRVLTGGCQCGAVRFRLEGTPGAASVCHCRMCQKAFGGYFAPLVDVGPGRLEWTRGAPARYQSSNVVRRGFCTACGTPLTYESPDGVALAHGAFDAPAALPPSIQYGVEGKLPFADHLAALPGRATDQEPGSYLARVVSRQHPDHDTAQWPPGA